MIEDKTKAIFDLLSDKDALKIFRTIGKNLILEQSMKRRVRIASKKYYIAINKLAKIGLVTKPEDKYKLTTLGFVVHQVIRLLDEAVNNYSKLKLIDNVTYAKDVSKEEKLKKIESILGIKIGD